LINTPPTVRTCVVTARYRDAVPSAIRIQQLVLADEIPPLSDELAKQLASVLARNSRKSPICMNRSLMPPERIAST
jgi:hypothetical protein